MLAYLFIILAVGILAILKKPTGPEILLQKQFRPPVGGVCIEMPAGLLESPTETAEQCAERELYEETGYVGKAAALLSGPVIFNDPGFCNTSMRLVTVHVDLNKKENLSPRQSLEEGEYINTFSVPLKSLYSELKKLEEMGYKLDARVQNLAQGIELAREYGVE